MSCPYCAHKEAIPTSAEQVKERSFEQYLQIRPEQMEQLAANALEVQCQSCGATVTFTPPEVARQCDLITFLAVIQHIQPEVVTRLIRIALKITEIFRQHEGRVVLRLLERHVVGEGAHY